MQTTITPPKIRLWTIEEYHRLAEVGILKPEEKVELIAGQIIEKMSPQGKPHAAVIRKTLRVLKNKLGTQVTLQSQLPIQLNDYSEPEPDIAVVKLDPLDYLDHHPQPAEVYLLVEVADSSIKTDCELKAKDYSRSGIKDYWVLDLNQRQLLIFRQPTQQGYGSEQIFAEDAQVSPLHFPDCTLVVAEILPPQNFKH